MGGHLGELEQSMNIKTELEMRSPFHFMVLSITLRSSEYNLSIIFCTLEVSVAQVLYTAFLPNAYKLSERRHNGAGKADQSVVKRQPQARLDQMPRKLKTMTRAL